MRRGALFCCACALAAALSIHGAASAQTIELTGQRSVHVVRKGESLAAISSRLGVTEKVIAQDNGLKPPYRLNAGDTLEVDNRHLIPERLEHGIVINIPQRMLFMFRGSAPIGAYPVALGRPDWRTPTGSYRVAHLERNKTWCVPKSIQEEMAREGKKVLTRVPPGPDNPLGEYWIGLSIPGYGIHSTIAPASIYRMRTHGCIRLHPDDAAVVFAQSFSGMPVKIVYRHALLGQLGDGRIVAEVNPDVYNQGGDALRLLRDAAAAQGLTQRIDWNAAAEVARVRAGVAREVGLKAATMEKWIGRKTIARIRRHPANHAQVVRSGAAGHPGAAACAREREQRGREDAVLLQHPYG